MPWAMSRSVSRRSSPSSPPVAGIERSSSSRSAPNVACSVSSGPKSSSVRSSHSAPIAARASSRNGDGGCSAPRSERWAKDSTRPSRARVIATLSSRRMSSTCTARVSPGSGSCSSASGTWSLRWRRAPGMRADCRPITKTWRNSRPCAACMASTATAPSRRVPASGSSSSSCSPASATAVTARAKSRPVACGSRRTCAVARSPSWASDTSASTTSAWAANSCWRRSPRRSTRRCTNRSGRVVSSAPAAARCSFRKRRIRSRASGGSWGDSVAATSAPTMSSLRRRAICTQRARSTERSPIGGRASARTTAPASPGSTSSRSQAITSRTSARVKNAVAPASR